MTDKERKIRSLKSHTEDPLLTLSEVAEQLGVVRSTVDRWIKEKRVRYVKLPGGRRRIRQSVVDTVREEQEANAQPEFYDDGN